MAFGVNLQLGVRELSEKRTSFLLRYGQRDSHSPNFLRLELQQPHLLTLFLDSSEALNCFSVVSGYHVQNGQTLLKTARLTSKD